MSKLYFCTNCNKTLNNMLECDKHNSYCKVRLHYSGAGGAGGTSECVGGAAAGIKISYSRPLTLPVDSAERKNYPITQGCLKYFPAALAGVARISKLGNDKHNSGEPLHHARGKSMDHSDCIVRHLIDLEDLLAHKVVYTAEQEEQILTEVSSLAWRALALSQELHENFGAPLAPGAKK